MSASHRRPPNNPLRRGMARAALVLAAGAAPVVATADTASAETNATDEVLNDTVRTANGLVEEAGGELVRTAMPIVMPALHQTVHDGAQTTAGLLAGVQRNLADRAPTMDDLAKTLPSPNGDLNGLTIN